MKEGTFLRFLISPEGITIDPRRIEAIKSIVSPHKKKCHAIFSWKNKLCEKIHFQFRQHCKATSRNY